MTKWHKNYLPTAVPKPGLCPTCGKFTDKWAACRPHQRWECPKHVKIQTHGITIGE